MRENRQSGSEGGGAETNRLSLPLFTRLWLVGFAGPTLITAFMSRRFHGSWSGLKCDIWQRRKVKYQKQSSDFEPDPLGVSEMFPQVIRQ